MPEVLKGTALPLAAAAAAAAASGPPAATASVQVVASLGASPGKGGPINNALTRESWAIGPLDEVSPGKVGPFSKYWVTWREACSLYDSVTVWDLETAGRGGERMGAQQQHGAQRQQVDSKAEQQVTSKAEGRGGRVHMRGRDELPRDHKRLRC